MPPSGSWPARSRKAALPIVAALGGMIVPAGMYLMLQSGKPGQSGWGIPVATEIAFVAGFLALLGSRVPASLKIKLMSLAIADDIGAILLIVFFYSTDISFLALGSAAAGFGATYIFNRIGVRQVSIYFLAGAGIWLGFLKSGVHPTVAGVLLGFLTPSSAWVGTPGIPNVLTKVLERVVARSDGSTQKQRRRALSRLATTAREGTSPLERLEFGRFTMSIFIPGLALQENLLDDGEIGTLVGSTISAMLGCVLLLMFMPKRSEAPVGPHEQKVGNKDNPGAQVSEENRKPSARIADATMEAKAASTRNNPHDRIRFSKRLARCDQDPLANRC